MTPTEFFTEALPYARRASAATGVEVSVILAQWAIETGYGGPDWQPPRNNPGNVGNTQAGGQVDYPTLEAGVQAYTETMMLGYYDAVRTAIGAFNQSIQLGVSPWAASHYTTPGHPPGSLLIDVITANGLTRYDGAPTPAPTPPQPKEDMATYYVTRSNGAGFVIPGDLSSKTGIIDAADAATLLATNNYEQLRLTDAQIDAIPNA